MTPVVGFIGLGLMGRPMASNLRKQGFTVIVCSRSRPPVDALVALGATAVETPADVARHASVIVTMLPDGPDVLQVVAGAHGVLESMAPGTVVVDSSTIAPATARALAERVAERGGAFLDAPVSGGEIGAIDGTLAFMVGGDGQVLERVRPVLAAMGNPEKIVHVGGPGAGQVCKACNQIVLGGTMAVVAEAIALARKSGIDPLKVREALLGGFAQSRVLDVHGMRMIAGNFKPGFKTKHFDKDLGIALATLAEARVPAIAASAVQQLVRAQMAAGGGDEDYSAIARVVFDLAGSQAT